MSNSKKLMKKIFLFILNTVLIVANALCVYGYLEAVLKRNFEMIAISVALLPIFLIIAVIFYFLKNYLNISKINRKLPKLAILIYLLTIFIDDAIQLTMKITCNILSYSSPSYPTIVIILVLAIILLIITIFTTIKGLLLK